MLVQKLKPSTVHFYNSSIQMFFSYIGCTYKKKSLNLFTTEIPKYFVSKPMNTSIVLSVISTSSMIMSKYEKLADFYRCLI